MSKIQNRDYMHYMNGVTQSTRFENHWSATICINGENVHIGDFGSVLAASTAVDLEMLNNFPFEESISQLNHPLECYEKKDNQWMLAILKVNNDTVYVPCPNKNLSCAARIEKKQVQQSESDGNCNIFADCISCEERLRSAHLGQLQDQLICSSHPEQSVYQESNLIVQIKDEPTYLDRRIIRYFSNWRYCTQVRIRLRSLYIMRFQFWRMRVMKATFQFLLKKIELVSPIHETRRRSILHFQKLNALRMWFKRSIRTSMLCAQIVQRAQYHSRRALIYSCMQIWRSKTKYMRHLSALRHIITLRRILLTWKNFVNLTKEKMWIVMHKAQLQYGFDALQAHVHCSNTKQCVIFHSPNAPVSKYFMHWKNLVTVKEIICRIVNRRIFHESLKKWINFSDHHHWMKNATRIAQQAYNKNMLRKLKSTYYPYWIERTKTTVKFFEDSSLGRWKGTELLFKRTIQILGNNVVKSSVLKYESFRFEMSQELLIRRLFKWHKYAKVQTQARNDMHRFLLRKSFFQFKSESQYSKTLRNRRCALLFHANKHLSYARKNKCLIMLISGLKCRRILNLFSTKVGTKKRCFVVWRVHWAKQHFRDFNLKKAMIFRYDYQCRYALRGIRSRAVCSQMTKISADNACTFFIQRRYHQGIESFHRLLDCWVSRTARIDCSRVNTIRALAMNKWKKFFKIRSKYFYKHHKIALYQIHRIRRKSLKTWKKLEENCRKRRYCIYDAICMYKRRLRKHGISKWISWYTYFRGKRRFDTMLIDFHEKRKLAQVAATWLHGIRIHRQLERRALKGVKYHTYCLKKEGMKGLRAGVMYQRKLWKAVLAYRRILLSKCFFYWKLYAKLRR